MSHYKILNSIIEKVAKEQGWTDIQHCAPYSWGYRYPNDVIPQPIAIDVELTDICIQAGLTLGTSGHDIAYGIAKLINPPVYLPLPKQKRSSKRLKPRGFAR